MHLCGIVIKFVQNNIFCMQANYDNLLLKPSFNMATLRTFIILTGRRFYTPKRND
jgi:hypothetical protein